jgi:hypothetical protein
MSTNNENLNNPRIAEIEAAMLQADFWQDKDKAQSMIKELQDLKAIAEEEVEELWVEMNLPLSSFHGEKEEYRYLEEELYYNP